MFENFLKKSLFLYAIFHCLEDSKVQGKDSSQSEINIFFKRAIFPISWSLVKKAYKNVRKFSEKSLFLYAIFIA